MHSAVYPFYFLKRSSGGVFCRRRLIGINRRGIALTVVASLFVYLTACTMAGLGLPVSAADADMTPAHHVHSEGAPQQADCCGIMQDTSVSARQKHILPWLFAVAFPFYLIGCVGLARSGRYVNTYPPIDTAAPPGRVHLESTLQPRAPPR